MFSTARSPFEAKWIQKHNELEELYAKGIYQPVLFHHFLLFLGPAIGALLIPHRLKPNLRYTRYLAFMWITVYGIWMMQTCRTSVGGNGFCIGVFVSTVIVRSALILVLHDPETEFKRLEKSYDQVEASSETPVLDNDRCIPSPAVKESREILFWQGYPHNFGHRVMWVLCLLCSRRGSFWNWRITTTRRTPNIISKEAHQGRVHSNPASDWTQQHRESTIQRLRKSLYIAAGAYLQLLLVKRLVFHDPYFWGQIDAELHVPILPWSWSFPASCLVSRLYRFAMYTYSLTCFISLFHSLSLSVPLALGTFFPHISFLTLKTPMDQHWMIPDAFGPPSSIWTHGLPGLSGIYWHQFFRFDFISYSAWILSCFPVRLRASPIFKSLVYLVVPSVISAGIHMAGSFTQFAQTKPMRNMMTGFLLHGLFTGAHRVWLTVIYPQFVAPRFNVPHVVRGLGNLVVTSVGLFLSMSLCSQDHILGGGAVDSLV
ncbi:hypothetical protein BDV39DRAFT_204486 [Aspergillus sergii]|uniref:Wax synthase domain-containing protein n=1 Tax=Aspergillus sergii TaxID=1034303 RepID=A0A5N6X6Y0_9EURO|nr:hypothetical protein BDV39DRAFT_204486 [Aspergillus sergii]